MTGYLPSIQSDQIGPGCTEQITEASSDNLCDFLALELYLPSVGLIFFNTVGICSLSGIPPRSLGMTDLEWENYREVPVGVEKVGKT